MKDNFNNKSKEVKGKILPLAIRTVIGLAIAMLLSLVGVVLICGLFILEPWLIGSSVIFGIVLLSVLLSFLLSFTKGALNRVLMTVYSFAVVGVIFSLLFYALISSKFNFEKMNWQATFKSFYADKLFHTIFISSVF